jgi:protease II
VVDVDDTVECVRNVVKQGLVDEKRVVIRGGSAGQSSPINLASLNHKNS